MLAFGSPEHADAGAALCALGHGPGVRTRCGLQGQRTQTLGAAHGLQLRAVPQSGRICRSSTAALPDFNLTELFRTNRYVGSDRIGDANQLALALTTRLFDHSLRRPVPVGDHRTNPLFYDPAGGPDRHRLHRPCRGRADVPSHADGESLGRCRGALMWRAAVIYAISGTIFVSIPHARSIRYGGFPRQPVASEPGQTSPTLPCLGHRRRRGPDRLQAL